MATRASLLRRDAGDRFARLPLEPRRPSSTPENMEMCQPSSSARPSWRRLKSSWTSSPRRPGGCAPAVSTSGRSASRRNSSPRASSEALDSGRAVGTLTLGWDDHRFWGEGNDAGYVHRLALVSSHRGGGLGHELLDWAESQVVAAGRRYLRLGCLAENGPLRAYYGAAGFEHRGDVSGESCDPCGAGPATWTVSLYERTTRAPDSSPPRSQGQR